jgi:hypothetical protein
MKNTAIYIRKGKESKNIYEIKENQKELSSEWRFYVVNNGRVVTQQLTFIQAKMLVDLLFLNQEETKNEQL